VTLLFSLIWQKGPDSRPPDANGQAHKLCLPRVSVAHRLARMSLKDTDRLWSNRANNEGQDNLAKYFYARPWFGSVLGFVSQEIDPFSLSTFFLVFCPLFILIPHVNNNNNATTAPSSDSDDEWVWAKTWREGVQDGFCVKLAKHGTWRTLSEAGYWDPIFSSFSFYLFSRSLRAVMDLAGLGPGWAVRSSLLRLVTMQRNVSWPGPAKLH
jgi:hypothetical protein